MSMSESTTNASGKSSDGGSSSKNQKLVPPGDGGLISEPTSSDVLSGRGGKINSHEGNVRFRELIGEHKHEYLAGTTKKLAKANIAAKIVETIRNLDPPGRFLKVADAKKGLWTEIGDEKARKKAGQALREDGPGIRVKIDESNKKKEMQENVMMNHPPYMGYPGHPGHPIPPHMLPGQNYLPPPMIPPGHFYPYPPQGPPHGYPPMQHLETGYVQNSPYPGQHYPQPQPHQLQPQPQSQPQNTFTGIQDNGQNQDNISTQKKLSQHSNLTSPNKYSDADSATFDSDTLLALTGQSDNSLGVPQMEAVLHHQSNTDHNVNAGAGNLNNSASDRNIIQQTSLMTTNNIQPSFASIGRQTVQSVHQSSSWQNTETYRDRNENDDDDDDEMKTNQKNIDENSIDMSWTQEMDQKKVEEMLYREQLSSSQQTLQTSGSDPNMWTSGNMNQQKLHPEPLLSQLKSSSDASMTSDSSDVRTEWRQQMLEVKAWQEKRNQMIAAAMEVATGSGPKLTSVSEDNVVPYDDKASIGSYSDFMSIGSATIERLANGEDSTMDPSISSQSEKNFRRQSMLAMSGKHPNGYPNSIAPKSTRSIISNITGGELYDSGELGSTWPGESTR